MQNNTKEYINEMLKDLEIQLNTIEAEVREATQIRRKLQKFYKKLSKNSDKSNKNYQSALKSL